MVLSTSNSEGLRLGSAFAAFCILFASGPAAAKATFVTFDAGIPTSINLSNTVAGYTTSDGFVRTADGTVVTFDVAGASSTRALGINDAGEITGFYRDSAEVAHGFIRAADGSITTFDVPKAKDTSGAKINRKGTIVGAYDDDNGSHGFVRTAGGRLKRFDVPDTNFTSPDCINDKGAITGVYSSSDGHLHGFVRAPDGAITTIDVPGALDTSVACINIKGTVVGSYGTDGEHGFIRYADGTITTFDGQDCNIFSADINDKGVVTGSCQDHQHPGRFLGFVRKPDGTVNEFRVPNGGNSTTPVGINNAGVIAGSYRGGGFLRFP